MMHRFSEADFESLLSGENITAMLYDCARLVDPARKQVLFTKGGQSCMDNCYAFWGKERICGNCISIRALKKGKPIYKMDYADSRFFLAAAFPLKNRAENLVVEVLKDVTDSLMDASYSLPIVMQLIDNLSKPILCDSLTGVYNKTYLAEHVTGCFQKVLAEFTGKALLYIEIDELKKLNISYGRAFGDLALVQVAQLIRSVIKPTDIVIRSGGDEFLVLMSGVTGEQAQNYLMKISEGVKSLLFLTKNQDIHISVSVGMALCEEPYKSCVDDYISAARLDMAERKARLS